MLPTVHRSSLAGYFSGSEQFYYLVTDTKGVCRYVNPLLSKLYEKQTSLIHSSLNYFFGDADKCQQVIDQCLQENDKPVVVQLCMNYPGVTTKPVNWEFSSFETKDNEMLIQGIGIPAVDEQLPYSQRNVPERYKAYEQSAEGIWRFDCAPVPAALLPDDIINSWRQHAFLGECNDNMARMYGFEKSEELVGVAFDKLIDFTDEKRLDNLRLFIRNGLRSTQVETKEFDRYGNTKYFLNTMEGTVENGMITRVWGTQHDITEQKLAEQKISYLAMLMESVSDVIVTLDLDKKITSWNKATEKLTGITEQEAVSHEFGKVLATDYSPFSYVQVADIVLREGIWKGEISFTGFDGEKKYLLHTFSRLNDEKGVPIGMLGVGKDITERKKIENRLQQSETFYRTLAANSLDGILMTDETGRIRYCGPSITTISGFELNHLLGHNIFEFVHPDDAKIALQAFRAELIGHTRVNYIVVRLLHATRGWIWFTVRGHNLLNDPVLGSVLIYFTDETRRKQIEDRLVESEQRFRDLIHNLKLGIILMNENSEVLVYNQAALSMLDMKEDELLSFRNAVTPWNVIHEDGSLFRMEEYPMFTAIKEKRSVKDVIMGVLRSSSNDRVWLLINAEPVLDEQKNIISIICSITDITEQRKLAQQLVEQEIQKQRLITQATIDGQEKERQEIGKELHDNINQHLTTTRLYLEVANEKASGEVLEMISLAHKNLAGIVNEIRSLSQSLVPPTLGDLGLAESIQDLCDALRRSHSYRVEFHHRHFSEDGLPDNLKLMIFRIIQEQISNIIRHAQAKTIRVKLEADAESIIFSVSDDGRGFDLHNYRKGMGFSNISTRAALFSGKAEIDSSPGHGCTVTVSIPLIPHRELI